MTVGLGSFLGMLWFICSFIDVVNMNCPFVIIRYGLEEVFMDYGVDFFLNGHEHNYVCIRVEHATRKT